MLPSVEISDGGGKCKVCHDEFEVDFNEDTDKWEYQNCVRYDGKNFHPKCCEDFKNGGGLFKSPEPSTNESEFTINGENPEPEYTINVKKEEVKQEDVKQEVTVKQEPSSQEEPAEVPETTEAESTEAPETSETPESGRHESESGKDETKEDETNVSIKQEQIKSPQVKQEPSEQVTIKQEKIEEDPPMVTQQAE